MWKFSRFLTSLGVFWTIGFACPLYAENKNLIPTPQKNSPIVSEYSPSPCKENVFYCNKSPYFILFSLGAGASTEGSSKNVSLSDDIVNRYTQNGSNERALLAGVGVGKHLRLLQKYSVDLGISGYYLNFGTHSGTVHPAYNLSPDFDTLNYKFNSTSAALLAEMRWFFGCNRFKPNLYLGMGAARNHLYDYRETPTDPSLTASPMLIPFTDRTQVNFAYSVGAGFTQFRNEKPRWSLEYRYLNLGDAELGKTPIQTTSQHLNLGNLSMNLLVFSFYLK